MKKTLSLILALCMCLTVVASITGCDSETDDPKHTHTYETAWSYDEEYHWHSCEDDSCSDVSQKAAHSFENGICACGYAEEAPVHTHTFETNWSYDETYHWYACEDDDCSDVSEKASHSIVNGACVCGYEEESPVHNHTFKTEWSYDETYHWYACEDESCSEVSQRSGHSFVNGICTCEYEDETLVHTHTLDEFYECTVCDYAYGSPCLKYVLNEDKTSYSIVGCEDDYDKRIVIPTMYQGLPVTTIGKNAFCDRYNIVSILINKNIKDIGKDAFRNCKKIIEIINHSEWIELDKDVSYYPSELSTFDIHSGYSKIVEYGEWLFYTCDNINYLVDYLGDGDSIIFPETYNGQSYEIFRYAFYHNENIVNVILSENIDNIGLFAFEDCAKLNLFEFDNALYLGTDTNPYFSLIQAKDKYIETCEIHNATELIGGGAFYSCYGLSSIKLSDSVKVIGHSAFNECYLIDTLDIPSSVEVIDDWAFACNNFNTLNIGSGIVKIGKYAFRGNMELLDITIRGNLEHIGAYAFSYCGFERFEIPRSVFSIGEKCFEHCENLSTIELHNKLEDIGSYLFLGCSNLTDIAINDGVKYLSIGMFSGCDKLTEIEIPCSIDYIDAYAFDWTLNHIYYQGSKEQWNNVVLQSQKHWIENADNWDEFEWIKIHFPGEASEGLEFESNGDGTCIVKGIGDCTDTDIIIPAISPEGDKVTRIWGSLIYGKGAFTNCENITSIVIPEGVGIPNLHPLKNNGVF